jgi:hypothetical protein
MASYSTTRCSYALPLAMAMGWPLAPMVRYLRPRLAVMGEAVATLSVLPCRYQRW